MSDTTTTPQNKPTPVTGDSLNPLAILDKDYRRWQKMYASQPDEIRQFLDAQAQGLAQLLVSARRQVWFFLPEHLQAGEKSLLSIPFNRREQRTGSWLDRIFRRPGLLLLRNRLDELEANSDEAVSLSAGLIRYTTATYLVYRALPGGQNVTFKPLAGEEIPTIPAAAPDSAEEDYAQQFFLSEWVVLNRENELLVPTSKEAEHVLKQMQEYFSVLHMAVRLSPYMVADPEYQRKRIGILGQLINQGRGLAWFQTRAIIALIRRRAEKGSLNRGLSISLPYFDDQEFQLRSLEFQIIPPGRIMFLLEFIARACRNEQGKVAQDTRLNSSTRNHLLGELRLIEHAFESETR